MFLWCHARHVNPVRQHAQRIKNIDRELAGNLNYDKIKFLVEEKYF